MTPSHRLILAHTILSSDAAFESDCVELDVIQGRPVTEREKVLASVISKLYRLIHPPHCAAGHEDWEGKNEKLLAKQ